MNMNQGNAGLSHYVFNWQKQGTVIKPLPGLALNCNKIFLPGLFSRVHSKTS